MQHSMMKFESKISRNLKRNQKAFYNYVNSKRKIKASLSGIRGKNGQVLQTAEEIADELGQFFESTFVTETMYDENDIFTTYQNTDKITDVDFDYADVQKRLSDLNIWKSYGPDQIHPKILKCLSDIPPFVSMIVQFFKKCYDSCEIPSVWKKAEIIALHKKGDKCAAENYRPISLTCVLSKIFEKILRNHILEFVKPHIVKDQHGFLPGRSCISNILECLDEVYEILSKKETLDILYLDFQKAFDTVPHKRLLGKLASFGIEGKVLKIVEDFLKNRTFVVKVGSSYSKTFNVISGVPQGTVLGPLLFLIYINDLPNGIKSFVSLFADDLKLIIQSSKHIYGQADLEKLMEWEKKWLLSFNVKDNKCKVMHVGKGNPCHSYELDGNTLPVSDCEKDLGVYTATGLRWTEHIQKAVNKAKSVSGWIWRNVISREKDVMLNVFKTLVRPHLEYGVQIWNLSATHGNWKMIMDLENIQRAFTRMINGIGLLTYEERLEATGLTTLLERRARGDLIETFKITSGIVQYGREIYRMSRSGSNIVKTNKNAQFLPNRVANYWNKLPYDVKCSSSVDNFKVNLEKYKLRYMKEGVTQGHYWELSSMLLSKINNESHDSYVNYMSSNPIIAKIKKINLK